MVASNECAPVTKQPLKNKLPSLLGATVVGLVYWLAACAGSKTSLAQDAPAILKLSIVDETTKKPTPARIEVLDKDGKAYVAENALLIGGD
jgi:hypothetical protein